jgi:hypothetical protein
MTKSSDEYSDLDFDRDLPTTPADVEALRAAGPQARLLDLKDINRLAPPEGFKERSGLRKPFGDWPPFEL